MTRIPTLVHLREAISRGEAAAVESALLAGFKIDSKDSEGLTVLMYAAQYQNPEIVQILLRAGANPTLHDNSGYDAGSIASYYGEYRMGAYTKESAEIVSLLKQYSEDWSPRRS